MRLCLIVSYLGHWNKKCCTCSIAFRYGPVSNASGRVPLRSFNITPRCDRLSFILTWRAGPVILGVVVSFNCQYIAMRDMYWLSSRRRLRGTFPDTKESPYIAVFDSITAIAFLSSPGLTTVVHDWGYHGVIEFRVSGVIQPVCRIVFISHCAQYSAWGCGQTLNACWEVHVFIPVQSQVSIPMHDIKCSITTWKFKMCSFLRTPSKCIILELSLLTLSTHVLDKLCNVFSIF